MSSQATDESLWSLNCISAWLLNGVPYFQKGIKQMVFELFQETENSSQRLQMVGPVYFHKMIGTDLLQLII